MTRAAASQSILGGCQGGAVRDILSVTIYQSETE